MNEGTIIETVIRSAWANVLPCYNVQRWRVSTVGGVSDAQAIADFTARVNLLLGEQDDHQCNIIYYQAWLLNEVYPSPRAIASITPTSVRGSISTAPLPIGAVYHASMRTGISRRCSHKYFSGGALAHVANGVLAAATLTMVNQTMTYYISGFTVSGRSYHSIVWDPVDLEWSSFTSFYVDPVVGYLRRRRPHI